MIWQHSHLTFAYKSKIMKKAFLLLSIGVAAFSANAQLTLSGSSYTQNFNSIVGALPTGWELYTGATSTSIGVADVTYGSGSASFGAYYDTTDCASDVFGTGFKNCASANGGPSLLAMSTCATQGAQTDRALGVRQCSGTSTTHPGFDPGPAFVLHLANTMGYNSFTCSFKLQGLDILSPRITTWTVDYGVGATPSVFTPVATMPSVLTTGGNEFTDTTVTASFGTALDNQSQPVYIRIVTLVASSGTGNRTTSAIDDFTLLWNSLGVEEVTANNIGDFEVIGAATSNDTKLQYTVGETGSYNLMVTDMAGRTIKTATINAEKGTHIVTLNGLNLASGIYIASLSNASAKAVARICVQ